MREACCIQYTTCHSASGLKLIVRLLDGSEDRMCLGMCITLHNHETKLPRYPAYGFCTPCISTCPYDKPDLVPVFLLTTYGLVYTLSAFKPNDNFDDKKLPARQKGTYEEVMRMI
jgi:hypothetical protein